MSERPTMAIAMNADPSRAAQGAFAVGMRTTLWNLLSLAIALGLWQLAALLAGSPFFPGRSRSPMPLCSCYARRHFGNSLLTHSWASIHRVLVGFDWRSPGRAAGFAHGAVSQDLRAHDPY